MADLVPVDHDPFQTDIGGVFGRNLPFVRPGAHSYNTALPGEAEKSFRQWLQQNRVPFDPDAPVTDYDMRGFWRALQAGDPRAASAVNPNDNQLHYPDFWKTPYHRSFSAESQWANEQAPRWTPDDKLVTPDGTVVFDERAQPQLVPIEHDPFEGASARPQLSLPPAVTRSLLRAPSYAEGETIPTGRDYGEPLTDGGSRQVDQFDRQLERAQQQREPRGI